MKITTLFKEFFDSEKAGGLILIICTLISLGIANSYAGEGYLHFWHSDIGGRPLEFWINDGLMTLFFLLIGLEIERELYVGELSNIKNALLPIAAALGGMFVPALCHFIFNFGTPTQQGFGIPMATDIAFSLGILSLLGNRVPTSLKVFLTALAIIDDLGAILIIAIFYSKGFSWGYFSGAIVILGMLLTLNRLKIKQIWLYLALGFGLWYCMLHSGIHATIAGVLLAFTIPFGDGSKLSTSYQLQHFLHKPVAFFIIPLFALANTGIVVPMNWTNELWSANSMGILTGLVLGKPLGITIFSLLAIGLGLCVLPSDMKKVHIVGAGFLAGIGFTMSIFITLLAFKDASIVTHTKIAILVASLMAGLLGYILLFFSLKKAKNQY